MPSLRHRSRSLARLSAALLALMAIAAHSARAAGTAATTRAAPIGGVVRPPASLTGAGRSIGARGAASELPGGDPTGPSGPPYGSPPLRYGGGPVMHDVTTHVIAWGPASSFPSGYVAGFEGFLQDLALQLGQSGNISSIATQYVDGSGSALSSLTNDAAINDSDGFPPSGCAVLSGASNCLTEAQVEAQLEGEIAARGLASDLGQSYIVLLPPGVDSCYPAGSGQQCEDTDFCGYHTVLTNGSSPTTFTLIPYTQSSYDGSGECFDGRYSEPGGAGADVMALDSIGAHELFESATDPVVGSGYSDAAGSEVADECAWFYGATLSATGGGVFNQQLGSDQYLIQEMWSNQDSSCEQGQASTATAEIAPAGLVVAGRPTTLRAALQNDGSPAGAYDWSYMSPDGTISPGVASGADPQLTFTSSGTYTVWVEITDGSGGMVTGVQNLTVHAPPTAAFDYSSQTGTPQAGSAISFSTRSSASGPASIATSAWDFGDGTTASGTAVSHTYSAAGTYTVTLTVTQTDGLTASAQQTITVAPAPPATSSGAPLTPAGSTASAIQATATRSWLRRMLAATAAPARIGALLTRGGSRGPITAPTAAGRITIVWYAVVHHHRILVARRAASVRAAVTAQVRIGLTAAGRRLLSRSSLVRITVAGSFRSTGAEVSATRTLTLRR